MGPVTRRQTRSSTKHSQRLAQPRNDSISESPSSPASDDGTVKVKEEVKEGTSPGWQEKEIEELLIGLLERGHMNIDEITTTRLPLRSTSECQYFVRCVKQLAQRHAAERDIVHETLTDWITECQQIAYGKPGEKMQGPLEIALVLKALSLDGVVENHPLPQHANGVDYGAIYRLLSQAVLGHPLQPLNAASLDALFDALQPVFDRAGARTRVIETVREHFQKKSTQEDKPVETVETKPSTSLWTPVHNSRSKNLQDEQLLVHRSPKAKRYERKKKPVPTYTVSVMPTDNVSAGPSFKVESRFEDPPIEVICKEEPEDEIFNDVGNEHDEGASASASARTMVKVGTADLVCTTAFNPLNVPVDWIIDSRIGNS